MLSAQRVQAVVPVTDLARARAFYERTLGLAPLTVLPAGTFYRVGAGTQFAISRNGGTPQSEHTVLAFLAEDVEAEVAELRSRGVTFEEYDGPAFKTVAGVAHAGAVTGAWFTDSEGNLIGVMHLDDT